MRKVQNRKRTLKESEIAKENAELRAAADKHDDQLAERDFELKEIKIELAKVRQRNEILEKEKDCFEHDDWVGKVVKSMSSEGRTEFRNAFTAAAPSLKRGTISRLRKTTKLNFSNITTNPTNEESDLKKKITQFALENTMDVPDKRKFIAGARFRTASLLTLHASFEIQYPNLCTYGTFAKYWPALFVKPRASDFGTCLCITCQNMELKVDALCQRRLIGVDQPGYGFDMIILESRRGNFASENNFKAEIESLAEEEKASIDIGFLQWEKVKQTEISKNTGKVKGDKTMRIPKHLPAAELGKVVLKEFEDYKEHLERDFVMKKELKKVRLEVNEDPELCVLHIDWAEQHKVTEIKEVQSAYFNGRFSYDLHTGYCYAKEDSHGFVSLSDSSDHKAEAVHNALRPTISKLVAKGTKRFVICSDSPTAQYRNSKNVILMRKFCEEFGISIRLLFTEAGHGKSPCDGVGGNTKNPI